MTKCRRRWKVRRGKTTGTGTGCLGYTKKKTSALVLHCVCNGVKAHGTSQNPLTFAHSLIVSVCNLVKATGRSHNLCSYIRSLWLLTFSLHHSNTDTTRRKMPPKRGTKRAAPDDDDGGGDDFAIAEPNQTTRPVSKKRALPKPLDEDNEGNQVEPAKPK